MEKTIQGISGQKAYISYNITVEPLIMDTAIKDTLDVLNVYLKYYTSTFQSLRREHPKRNALKSHSF